MTIKYTPQYLDELIKELKTPERGTRSDAEYSSICSNYSIARQTARLLKEDLKNKELESNLEKMLTKIVDSEEKVSK